MPLFKTSMSRMVAVAIFAAGTGLGAGMAVAGQPDMEGALHALESAQGHLSRVTQNKGGHAAAARQLVAQAISEVQAGIMFGHAQGE
ncbi:hypothetical protein ACELLULO517_05100 [Acidisoma cellulosilytica]|uniref:Uncharacterized protein n=1 Tax=Acidisoma cellulosilyticum TaxID=2802395 RepID=A0A964E2U8_9PROT|nr:hypothetical protein [Acidisoma cellulosilyticum]MCB8879602.1 hypothetical protein [Acidisoma cellulosilyticum]